MYKESNEDKLSRYAIKLGFLFFIVLVLYVIVSLAEGDFTTTNWSNVGATVYLLMGCTVTAFIVADR
jgi:hypothetical protein